MPVSSVLVDSQRPESCTEDLTARLFDYSNLAQKVSNRFLHILHSSGALLPYFRFFCKSYEYRVNSASRSPGANGDPGATGRIMVPGNGSGRKKKSCDAIAAPQRPESTTIELTKLAKD